MKTKKITAKTPVPPGMVRVKTPKGDYLHVKLGRRKPRPGQKTLRFGYYVHKYKGVEPPESLDFTKGAEMALKEMLGNDEEGDCVIAGKEHMAGMMAAANGDPVPIGTTDEALTQYHRICGRGDNGCNIVDVLNEMVSGTFMVGGKPFPLTGFVQVEKDPKLYKIASQIFGPNTFGLNLPSAWTNSEIWDKTNTRSVGGHDVTGGGFDKTYIKISSWGHIYKMTWPGWQSSWNEEMYFALAPMWTGSDKLSPYGIAKDQLERDLELAKKGLWDQIPPAAIHRMEDVV